MERNLLSSTPVTNSSRKSDSLATLSDVGNMKHNWARTLTKAERWAHSDVEWISSAKHLESKSNICEYFFASKLYG